MIFDGRAFAKEKEEALRVKVAKLAVKPKIVSVLVGGDPASEMYVRLKNQAAIRCDIDFLVEKLDSRFQIQEIKDKIAEIGARDDVTGVMVQLPVLGLQGQALKEVLGAIPLTKDVDGLRWEESNVRPATVRAILSILERIEQDSRFKIQDLRVVVLGARGAVGKPLVFYLRKRGVEVSEVEWDTPDPVRIILGGDVVISSVGKPGLVTGEMIKPGVIAIDVGISISKDNKSGRSTVGDMADSVYNLASVAVPVPGGVGPVTVISLLENTVEIYEKSRGYTGVNPTMATA